MAGTYWINYLFQKLPSWFSKRLLSDVLFSRVREAQSSLILTGPWYGQPVEAKPFEQAVVVPTAVSVLVSLMPDGVRHRLL